MEFADFTDYMYVKRQATNFEVVNSIVQTYGNKL